MNSGPLARFGRATAILAAALACAVPGRGKVPDQPADPGQPPVAYTADQLDQLLGPIALYPDPLVALILPAATSPGDLVSAASYVAAQADPYAAGSQPWSDSVKALVHYPEVVEWMAGNLTWVQAVGAAFAAAPADVMQSIQRLRSRALALGTLVSTPQQEVVVEEGLIEILPADADVIYVPRYNPAVVYLEEAGAGSGPFVSFGIPYRAGLWLNYGFDWRRQALFVGHFARDGQGWRRPAFFGQEAHAWHPANHPSPPPVPALRPGEPLARPSLLRGAPSAGSTRWNRLPERPGFNPSLVPAGQRPVMPGSALSGPPGSAASAEWQAARAREMEMRRRELQTRDPRPAPVHAAVMPPAAHPAAPPPRPPAPPPSSAPANGSRDHDQDRH